MMSPGKYVLIDILASCMRSRHRRVNDQHIIQGKLFIYDKGKLSVLHCIHELLLLF